MPVQIGIVDDNTSNRNILKNKLLRHGHFVVTLTAIDGQDFLTKMPNMDGVDAIAAGSFLYPSVKFVVLTIFDDEDKIFSAIKAGAFGYLLKDESAENISDMLWQMHESGAGPISPGIAHKILQLVQQNELTLLQKKETVPKTFFDLTHREQEILQLLAQGLLYKQIADQLGISANTAKKHVLNTYHKLHVNTRTHALQIAKEKGLL
jgi:DNA-binding NarL/FixJ family response regulator